MTDHFKIRTQRYATVVLRSLLVTAVGFVAIMSAGIYVTDHLLAKVYSATASIQVLSQAVNLEAYSGWAFSSPQSRDVQAELESIESPDVLQTVVSRLGLDKTWAERVFNRSDSLTAEEARYYLASKLRLNFKHGTNVVEVTALSDDPKEAAQIANAVVDSYKLSRDTKTTTPGEAGGIRVVQHAEVPYEPTKPDKRFCYGLTAGLAGALSVMLALTLEMGLLIARAEAAAGELKV